MFYRCYDCKGEFSKPEIVSEHTGDYMGMKTYEDFAYCPYCGCDWFEEVYEDEEEEEETEESEVIK